MRKRGREKKEGEGRKGRRNFITCSSIMALGQCESSVFQNIT